VIVAGGNRLNGLWFETWSRSFRKGVVGYCSSIVWQVGSFGGLEKILVCKNMLCGGLPTLRVDFQCLVIVSCDGCNLGALAQTR
jgi:hypothetical protein